MTERSISNLDKLPGVLEFALQRIEVETHPEVRLWRVCDAAELLVRLIAAASVAAIESQPGGLPHDVARWLASGHTGPLIYRPALGVWLAIAQRLSATVSGPVGWRPSLRESVQGVLVPLLEGRVGSQTHGLLRVRNDMAHGMGLSQSHVKTLVGEYEPAFQKALDRLEWLRGARLFAADGADQRPIGPRLPEPADDEGRHAEQPLHVKLAVGETHLDLWPLFARGIPSAKAPGAGPPIRGDRPTVLAYRRCVQRGSCMELESIALGSVPPQAILVEPAPTDLMRRFGLKGGRDDFSARIDLEQRWFPEALDEARRVVGREDLVRKCLERIERVGSGVLWLPGAPGSGKSALLSTLFSTLLEDRQADTLALLHRFRRGGAHASLDALLRHMGEALRGWRALGAAAIPLPSGPDGRLRDVRQILSRYLEARLRLVILLDGLDEAAAVDPAVVTLPLELEHPRVLWVCAGRPSRELETLTASASNLLVHEGPDGLLPVLDSRAITRWLKEQAPSRVRDEITRNEAEGTPDPWVGRVAAQSKGLPAYIALLVQDLAAGAKARDSVLPSQLPGYFRDLLGRVGGDSVSGLVAYLLHACVLTAEPPPQAWLAEVLGEAGLFAAEYSVLDRERMVRAVLDRCEGLLERVGTRPSLGIAPYHEELRRHLERDHDGDNPRGVMTAAISRLALRAADLRAPEAGHHALRTGVRDLLTAGRDEDAARLVCDLRHAAARFSAAGSEGVSEILADLRRVRVQQSVATTAFLELERFWSRFAPRIARGGAIALWQAATGLATDSAIARSAEQALAAGGARSPQLFRLGLPKRPLWPVRIPLGPGTARVGSHGFRGPLALREHPSLAVVAARGEGRLELVSLEAGVPSGMLPDAPARSEGEIIGLLNGIRWVVTWDATGLTLPWWDLTTEQPPRLLSAHSPVTAAASAPDGQHIVSGHEDGSLVIWDLSSGSQCAGPLQVHEGPVGVVHWCSANGRIVSVGPTGRMLTMRPELDETTDSEVPFPESGRVLIEALASAGPGRQWLIAGTSRGALVLWSDLAHPPSARIEAHDGAIDHVATSADGRIVASAGDDGVLRTWTVDFARQGLTPRTSVPVGAAIQGLDVNPAGTTAVTSANGNLGCWDISLSTAEAEQLPHPGGVRWLVAVAGNQFVSVGGDGRIQPWDAMSGRPGVPQPVHRGSMDALAVSADAGHLYTAGPTAAGRVGIVRGRGAIAKVVAELDSPVVHVALSPDTRSLACADRASAVRSWARNCLGRYRRVWTWQPHPEAPEAKPPAILALWAGLDRVCVGVQGDPTGALVAIRCSAGTSADVTWRYEPPQSTLDTKRTYDVQPAALFGARAGTGREVLVSLWTDDVLRAVAIDDGRELWSRSSVLACVALRSCLESPCTALVCVERDARSDHGADGDDSWYVRTLAVEDSQNVRTLGRVSPSVGDPLLAVDAVGGRVAVGTSDERVHVFGLRGDALGTWYADAPIRALAASPSGSVAYGDADGRVVILGARQSGD